MIEDGTVATVSASLAVLARGIARAACAAAVGLGSGLLVLGLMLSFGNFFDRLLPGNLSGLSLLVVPPILAIVCVANSWRLRLRSWFGLALVIAAACVLIFPVDVG